jgi:multimeric flavodoxin WrbA
MEDNAMKRILVVYHSQQHGNTRKMAEQVAEGCRQVPGVEVEVVNVNEQRVDMDALVAADGLALGTPDYFTYMAGGLKQFFDDALLASYGGKQTKGKPYVAFLTHGGGGKGIESVLRLAKSMEYNAVAEPVVCKGAPEGDAARQSTALGRALAEHVAKG